MGGLWEDAGDGRGGEEREWDDVRIVRGLRLIGGTAGAAMAESALLLR